DDQLRALFGRHLDELRMGTGLFGFLVGALDDGRLDAERARCDARVLDELDRRRSEQPPPFARGCPARDGRQLLAQRVLDRPQGLRVLRIEEEDELVRNVDVRNRHRLLLLHRPYHALAELDRLDAATGKRAREESFDDRLEATFEVAQDPHPASLSGPRVEPSPAFYISVPASTEAGTFGRRGR